MLPTLLTLAPLSGGEGGGFNPIDLATGGNLFWTLVIFLAAVPFMWIVVMGPVTKALAERDEKTEQAVAAAQKASQDSQAALAALEKSLSEAQASAAKLVAEARTRAETRGQEILEAAKVEATQLVEGARRAIRAEQDKAIGAIRNEVVNLSLRAASKVLERNVGGEDDRRFVEKIVTAEKVGRG
jgi:F-type H+-transporting ATPase subunit b